MILRLPRQIRPQWVTVIVRSLSQAFAGQNVGIKEVSDRIWLVTFMHYDLGFFDHEVCRLEPVADPFEPKVSPMSPV